MTNWALTTLLLHLWSTTFIVFYFFKLRDSALLTKIKINLPFLNKPSNENDNENSIDKKYPITNTNFNKTSTQVTFVPDNDNDENESINLNTNDNTTNECKIQNELKDEYEKLNSNQAKKIPNTNESSSDGTFTTDVDLDDEPLPINILVNVSWLLFNIVSISAVVVTITYFSYIYLTKLSIEPEAATIIQILGNLHRHGFNSLVIIIDVILLSYPIRILHFVYTNIFGYVYVLITFLYWLSNPHTNIIYITLDYNVPLRSFSFFFIVTFSTFILQFMHYLVFKLKFYIKYKLYAKSFK